jgi:hypothetical protein
MSSTTKYSNYASFQNCNSKLIQMQQFDKSGNPGQVIGSAGENGLIWVDRLEPITPSPAPSGSNFALINGQQIYDNDILTYNGSNISSSVDLRLTSGAVSSNLSYSTLKLTDNSAFSYNEMRYDGNTIRNLSNGGNMLCNYYRMLINNDITGIAGIYSNEYVYLSKNGLNTIGILNTPSITLNDATYSSLLTTTNLTFNGTQTTTVGNTGINITDGINTSSLDIGNLLITDGINYSNIVSNALNTSDGTNLAILSPTDLTFNNISYSRNMVNSSLIYSAAIIYADGTAPATNLTIRNTYGYNGWYFKNTPPAGKKINWYFSPQQTNTTTVADIKGLAVSFFNGITTSNDDTLFLTIYTVPTGSGDYAPGFYHSAMTYVFDQTVTPIANTNYQGIAICDTANVPFYYERQVAYEPSTVNNPKGTYLPTDKVLAVVIGSNSASSVNTVEFVVSKLNIIMNGFTKEFLLVSP